MKITSVEEEYNEKILRFKNAALRKVWVGLIHAQIR